MLRSRQVPKKKSSGLKGLIITASVLSVVVAALIILIILEANGVFDAASDKTDIVPPKTVGDTLTDGDYSYVLLEDGGAMIVLFNGEPTEVITVPSTVGGHPVYAVGEVSYALIDEIIKEVRVPEGVSYIGKGAFTGIENATLYLPSSIEQIDDMAFYGFDDPVAIYYAGSRAEWAKVKIGSDNKVLANVICED